MHLKLLLKLASICCKNELLISSFIWIFPCFSRAKDLLLKCLVMHSVKIVFFQYVQSKRPLNPRKYISRSGSQTVKQTHEDDCFEISNLPRRLTAFPHFPLWGAICAPFTIMPLLLSPESSNKVLADTLSKLRWIEGVHSSASKETWLTFGMKKRRLFCVFIR